MLKKDRNIQRVEWYTSIFKQTPTKLYQLTAFQARNYFHKDEKFEAG